MKNVLIVEDNQTMLQHMTDIVQEADIKNQVFAYDNVKDAYQCALRREIDLFIVDIILDTERPGDSSGLSFVDDIRQVKHYAGTPVIFVTSLEDAKLYTYEKLHCYRFLEKPFEPETLRRLAEECLSFSNTQRKDKILYFRKEGIILSVNREDIVYAGSNRHIISIHTKRPDTLTIPYITLKQLLEELDSSDFIQCSRNTIVNKKYIHNIDYVNRYLQLKDGFGTVEIGAKYKKNLKEMFM